MRVLIIIANHNSKMSYTRGNMEDILAICESGSVHDIEKAIGWNTSVK